MSRAILLGLALLGASACTYENPYSEIDRAALQKSDVGLEVTFLSSALLADGLAHVAETEFRVGQPIYMTVVLRGTGTAKIEGRLQASERDRRPIAVIRHDTQIINGGALSLASDFKLAPGSYYVSVIVNGTPSWGLPFTIRS